MISVEEAKKLIIKSTVRLNPIQQNISQSLFHVLAENVFSPIDSPPFNQSSMDGFAVIHSDILSKKKINVIGEVPAGNPFYKKISSNQSVKIYTGGKIPEGADTVIMQENILTKNKKIFLKNFPLVKGAYIREKGSVIKKGKIILKKGIILNPGAIGFLTSVGIDSVKVFPKPKVSIIITGNELQNPGRALMNGQVYESNSFSLKSAFEAINIFDINIFSASDEEKIIRKTLASAILNSDIILVSGGISVGKYDFVVECFSMLKVKNIFYKVSQKPGKPLFFGKKNNCLLFALPGNPASALTCFYEYVYPAVRTMQGYSEVFLKKLSLPTSSDYHKQQGLSFFLKGKTSEGHVDIFKEQESNNIGSFAFANCLIYLPSQKKNIKSGEKVEVHLLPDQI